MMDFQTMRSVIERLKDKYNKEAEHGFLVTLKKLVDQLCQADVPVECTMPGYNKYVVTVMGESQTFQLIQKWNYNDKRYDEFVAFRVPDSADSLESYDDQKWALDVYAKKSCFNDIFAQADATLEKQTISVTTGEGGQIKAVRLGRSGA